MPACIVCSKPSKYCCPKCKVKYCSLAHYKSHNLYCTEQFYQNQVQSQLHNLKSSPEDQKKMRQILKNAQLEDSLNDNIKQRYEELLEKLQNGQNLILTYAEEMKFAEWMKGYVMEDGEKMFWEEEDGMSEYYITEIVDQSKQKDIGEQEDQEKQPKNQQLIFYRRQYKQMISSFPSITSLCSSPHPSVIYHIYSLTLIGCIGFRYYDNQISNVGPQFSNFILKLCPINTSLPIFQSISCCHYFLQSQEHSNLIKPWILIASNDTCKLWKNKYLVLQMLLRINQTIKSKKTNIKIDFYLSYIRDNEQRVKKLQMELQDYIIIREVQKQGKQHAEKYKGLITL